MISGAAKTESSEPCWDGQERIILQELSQDDRRNLGLLIDHYGEPLMRYLTVILGKHDTAEDVFQDTWIKVMEKFAQFDQDRKFSAWLFRIARNSAFDRFRRQRWRRWLSLTPVSEDQPVPEIAAPGDLHHQLVQQDMARSLMARLEPVLRELIHVRFFEGLSYEEIAERCGMPLGTVKSRLARAMDQMAKNYQVIGGSQDG